MLKRTSLKELYAITKFIFNHPLTKENRLKAIISLVRWQIGVSLLRRKVIVPWVEDSKFIVGKGETGLTGNLYTGLMEYEDMLFLLHALQPDETFIDVGANVGDTAALVRSKAPALPILCVGAPTQDSAVRSVPVAV